MHKMHWVAVHLVLVLLVHLSAAWPENSAPKPPPVRKKLISELDRYFDFDHNLFLFDSSVDIDRFCDFATERNGPSTPLSLNVFHQNFDGQITGLEHIKEIWSKNTLMIVVVSSRIETKLLAEVKRIQLLRCNIKIGIFVGDPVSTDDMYALFRWCWDNRIINIFVATPHNNVIEDEEMLLEVFSYDPFGAFKVVNVTGSEKFDDFFLRQNSNFQRYPFKMRQVPFSANKDEEIFWSEITNALNATPLVVPEKNYDALFHKVLHVRNGPQIFGMDFLYATSFMNMIIMAPESEPYSEFSDYLKELATDTLLIYSLATVAVIIIALTFFQYKRQKKISIFETAADVFNLLMNDNGFIRYQRLSLGEALIVVPLTFAGLIFVNGILSAFQSYVTRPILQPQIETLDDFYNSPFKLIVHDRPVVQRHQLDQWGDNSKWEQKIRDVTTEEYGRLIMSFNRSVAFVYRLEESKYLLKAQAQLNVKGYHITKEIVSVDIQSYSIVYDFPFRERLNELIFRFHSAGLLRKWMEFGSEWRRRIVVGSYRENVANHGEVDNSNVEPFEMPSVLVYGWIASTTVFVLEIIWKKLAPFLKKAFLNPFLNCLPTRAK